MRMLQKGDKCPMCGRPIKTDDPNKLIVISAFGWIREQADAGKWHPENSMCEDSSTGASNADKLRSLPDEELAGMTMCPVGVGDFAANCQAQTGDPNSPPADCTNCVRDWVKAPYTGWEN